MAPQETEGSGRPVTQPDWSSLCHAYGPAVDTPELIRALRSPDAGEAIGELYSSITHQGTRYPATAAAVPLLVDAALDPAVAMRPDVLGLLEFCAVGQFGHTIDWGERRDQQEDEGSDAKRAWQAVHGERVRVRRLLDDADPEVHRAAVTLLAWMGDNADALRHAIARDIDAADERTACNAWLAACVLGVLPSEVAAPTTVGPGSLVVGFGRSMAALRFAAASVPAEAVDLLVDVLDSTEAHRVLSTVELLAGDGSAERYAALVLELTPPALHGHLSERLLPKIARGSSGGQMALEVYLTVAFGTAPSPTKLDVDELSADQWAALERLLPAIAGWDLTRYWPSPLADLAYFGLPDTPPELAEWLGTDLPHPTPQRPRRPWRWRQ